MKKRKISVGFLEPEELEEDTIYVQWGCRHSDGGSDYVEQFAISNVPFRACYDSIDKEPCLKEYSLTHSPNRYFDKEIGMLEYKGDLELFAKSNDAKIVYDRLEEDGIEIMKKLRTLYGYLDTIGSFGKSGKNLTEKILTSGKTFSKKKE